MRRRRLEPEAQAEMIEEFRAECDALWRRLAPLGGQSTSGFYAQLRCADGSGLVVGAGCSNQPSAQHL